MELRAFAETGQGRSWASPLYFEAEIEQSNRRRPNKAEIRVYNLSAGSIAWLESQGELVEVLTNETLLFRGDIRKVESTQKIPDIVTTITAGDGGSVYRTARVSRSYSPGITSTRILADLAADAGLPVLVSGTLPELVFESGFVVAGRVVESLHDLVEDLGAESSIQNGALVIIAPDAPKTGGPLIKAGTGLIGVPERKKRVVSFRATLYPRLRPGQLFQLESRFLSGWHRVTKTRHKVNSKGDQWETEIESRRV
jgi:hypothetical protein